MEKLKAIQFNFENCESEQIPIEYIPYFNFKNVYTNLSHRWGHEEEDSDVLKTGLECDGFTMIADWDRVNSAAEAQADAIVAADAPDGMSEIEDIDDIEDIEAIEAYTGENNENK